MISTNMIHKIHFDDWLDMIISISYNWEFLKGFDLSSRRSLCFSESFCLTALFYWFRSYIHHYDPWLVLFDHKIFVYEEFDYLVGHIRASCPIHPL